MSRLERCPAREGIHIKWLYLSSPQIDYASFSRDFYEEHKEITNLSKQELFDLKKKLGLKVLLLASHDCHMTGLDA